jgi:hypothetical protein
MSTNTIVQGDPAGANLPGHPPMEIVMGQFRKAVTGALFGLHATTWAFIVSGPAYAPRGEVTANS